MYFYLYQSPSFKDRYAGLCELSENFAQKNILITGNPYFMEELEYPDNVLLIPEIEDLTHS